MSANLIELLVKSLGETCYMVLIAIVLATLIGLPLGVILTVTRKDHIMPNALVHNVLGAIVNATRSTPFIILMVAIIPFTRMIVGSSIGTTAAIVPLTITAAPFIARVIESLIALIGASAMAGALGGGGLGDLAIRYGYQRFQMDVMVATVIVLIIMVQGVQTIGNMLSRKLNKNKLS